MGGGGGGRDCDWGGLGLDADALERREVRVGRKVVLEVLEEMDLAPWAERDRFRVWRLEEDAEEATDAPRP